jgi:hypothetical protein
MGTQALPETGGAFLLRFFDRMNRMRNRERVV